MTALQVIITLVLCCLHLGVKAQFPDIRDVEENELFPGTRLACPNIWFHYDKDRILVRPVVTKSPEIQYDVKSDDGVKASVDQKINLSHLQHNGMDSLNLISEFLKKFPYLVVELGVHVDCRTSPYYSRCLSCRRAKVIRDSLIAKGINRERIVAKGYQGELPLISCDDIEKLPSKSEQEKAHQSNRRVELKILSTDYVASGYLYKGVNGHRNIAYEDEIQRGDEFELWIEEDWFRHYGLLSNGMKELLEKLQTCNNCAYELQFPKSKFKSRLWKLHQLEKLIYNQKMNEDQFVIELKDDLADSLMIIQVSEKEYDKPFLMFKGQRAGRDIYEGDTLKSGDEFLMTVEYDYDRSDILEVSKMQLNWLAKKLMLGSTFEIEIESHTDCRGNDQFNKKLSERRAEMVANYLKNYLNTADDQTKIILSKGMGESDPLNKLSCEEISKLPKEEIEEACQMNRRTVVKVNKMTLSE